MIPVSYKQQSSKPKAHDFQGGIEGSILFIKMALISFLSTWNSMVFLIYFP